MSTRKKRFILGLTGGVMALGLVGVIASQNTFNIGIGVHAEDPNNILWKHYAAVEASPIMHGSKEFWANCSELGTHSFTKPTTGRIEEGGDFSTTSYFAELTPKDDRYVGYEETSTYYEGWNKNDFTFENGASFKTLNTAFDFLFWDGKKVDRDAANAFVAEFGKTENDGWLMTFGDNLTGTISLPKTNFHTLLDGGKIIRTDIGGFNQGNRICLNRGKDQLLLSANGKTEQSLSCLTKISLTIYEDSYNKVRLHFIDKTLDKPCSDPTRYGEIVLTDDEANGVSSLILSTAENKGSTRLYWLGKLCLTNGERVYKDFSAKAGYTATGADSYTFEETLKKSGNPSKQVYASIHPTNLAVGICGNVNTSATLTLDKINYKGILDNNEGVHFTIGAFNGGEYISYNGKNLGNNGPYPKNSNNLNDGALLTKESLEYTWKNWQIAINKTGMHVYNVFENTYTTFKLTDKQLNGEESLEFKLAKTSKDRFFLLTNMMTYHI